MNLYAWYPAGHGQYSFFVAAESEEQAKAAVDAKVAEFNAAARFPPAYESEGWGTSNYVLEVAKPGQVLWNEND